MPHKLPSINVNRPLVLPNVVPLATLVNAKAATNVQFAINQITENSMAKQAVSKIESDGNSDASTRTGAWDTSLPGSVERGSFSIRACVSVFHCMLLLCVLIGILTAGRRPSIDDARGNFLGGVISVLLDRPTREDTSWGVGRRNPNLYHHEFVLGWNVCFRC